MSLDGNSHNNELGYAEDFELSAFLNDDVCDDEFDKATNNSNNNRIDNSTSNVGFATPPPTPANEFDRLNEGLFDSCDNNLFDFLDQGIAAPCSNALPPTPLWTPATPCNASSSSWGTVTSAPTTTAPTATPTVPEFLASPGSAVTFDELESILGSPLTAVNESPILPPQQPQPQQPQLPLVDFLNSSSTDPNRTITLKVSELVSFCLLLSQGALKNALTLAQLQPPATPTNPTAAPKEETAVDAITPPPAKRSRQTSKRYQCSYPGCTHTSTRKYNIRTHEQTHQKDRARPHKCPHPQCTKSFARPQELVRHQRAHDPSKACVCKGCGRGFTRQDALRRHMKDKLCGDFDASSVVGSPRMSEIADRMEE
ncbi:hypothetical protein HK102_008695 [Quaeritorhiza haematococci]|nr:hypothetical protein HK102_008695 [Quaeritorhiza haematococci]